jgi:4-hydroxybenzoyl-CoA reductase subunit beta
MEALPDFRLHRPTTLAEAVAILAETPAARPLAGGTDLIVNLRRGLVEAPVLVDLAEVAELRAVDAGPGGLRIGSGVTLAALAATPAIARDYGAIAEAAAAVAGRTHRNAGTVGGNLCLDTRCIYYNQSDWWRRSNDFCLKYRGEVCHVAPKSKRCFATFSGDLAPALLIHDAEVEIAGPGGERRIPLAALYTGDGIDYLTLRPGEVLAAVHVPTGRAGLPQAYAKSRVRCAIDFPLVGLAVSLRMDGGRIGELRAALTAVDMRPFLVTGTDALVGAPADEDTARAFGELAREQASPMRTTTVKPWYRRRVAAALARRLMPRLARG